MESALLQRRRYFMTVIRWGERLGFFNTRLVLGQLHIATANGLDCRVQHTITNTIIRRRETEKKLHITAALKSAGEEQDEEQKRDANKHRT